MQRICGVRNIVTSFTIFVSVCFVHAQQAISQVYNVVISGTVLQRSFTRQGQLQIASTVDRIGTQNGINPNDIFLVSGNPGGTPDVGAIWYMTNSAFINPRGALIDTSFVSFNPSNRIFTIRPDSRVAGIGVNLFTASSSFISATPFQIYDGSLQVQVSGDLKTVNGVINVVGRGYTFSSQNQYIASFRGTRVR